VLTLTFGHLVATNFAVSAVAQTVTTGSSGNYSTATANATNATTTSGDNATGGNNTENPVSKVPLIEQFFMRYSYKNNLLMIYDPTALL
jgi:hypothetical protein